jgi:hypothetical protein
MRLRAGKGRGGIDRPVRAAPIGLETGTGGRLFANAGHRSKIARLQSRPN